MLGKKLKYKWKYTFANISRSTGRVYEQIPACFSYILKVSGNRINGNTVLRISFFRIKDHKIEPQNNTKKDYVLFARFL